MDQSQAARPLEHAFLIGLVPTVVFGVITDLIVFNTPNWQTMSISSLGWDILWIYNSFWFIWGPFAIGLAIRALTGPFEGMVSIWKGSILGGAVLGGLLTIFVVLVQLSYGPNWY